MKRLLFGVGVLVLSAFCLAPVFAEGEGEEAPPAPTPNDEAKAFADQFLETMKKKSSAEIIEELDKVVAFYKNENVNDPKVKDSLVDCVAKATTANDKLVVAQAMKKCGEMDDKAVNIAVVTLQRELKAKVPDDRVYEAALEAIGKLRSESPAVLKVLMDLLKNKDDAVISRAAYAISLYEGASGKVRKELFEEVLKNSEGVYAGSQSNNENMKRRWTIIGDDIVLALNKLSVPPREGGDLSNPADARKWYNDHKKASWEKQG